MVKKLEGAGLRGQVAGETSLCTVGQEEGLANPSSCPTVQSDVSPATCPRSPAPSNFLTIYLFPLRLNNSSNFSSNE